MPSAPVTSSFRIFEIKSAQWPLMALLLRSFDLQELQREWEKIFLDQGEFFDQDPLLLDLSALPQHGVPDFVALLALLRSKHLRPVAYKGGTQAQREAAQQAGLDWADEALTKGSVLRDPKAVAPLAQDEEPPATALVVDRPLRSGQQVYARGRDLVVTAMVNPGADVVADGNIHVYAPLRGKAMAGARGAVGARIFAREFEAELVSIAGVYKTSEIPWPEAVKGKAVQVRLDSSERGDHVLIVPLD